MKEKNTTIKPKSARFKLYTKYAQEHVGLRSAKEGENKTPFPGVLLISIRLSQLNKLTKKQKIPIEEVNNLILSLEKDTEIAFEKLNIENDSINEILKSDNQIEHNLSGEIKNYTIAYSPKIVWKLIRLLILYDTIVKKYLILWETAGIEKNTCFSRIKKSSTTIRRVIQNFNSQAKHFIYPDERSLRS